MSLVTGIHVVFHLRDGSRVEGVVQSVGWRVGSEYDDAYRDYQKNNTRGPLLPDLGAAEFTGEGKPGRQPVTLLGLDERGVVVRRRAGAPERIRYQAVESVMARGRTADASLLRSLALEGRAPLLTEIRLIQPPNRVAIDQIVSLERPAMKGQALEGAAFGLFLDGLCALIAYMALSSLKDADFGIRWP